MPALHEVQAAMRAALLGGDGAAFAGLVRANGIAPAARLGIYRANVQAALTGALRLTFPIVDQLVGAEFFDAAALRFIEAAPPRSPLLARYGDGFADFLAADPTAAALAYLADVARLEWAMHESSEAEEAAPVSVTALAGTLAEAADLRFTPHPTLRLLALAHPADAIWEGVRAGDDDALAALDVRAGPVHLAVQRRGETVGIARLAAAEWHFLAALAGGQTLSQASAAAPEAAPHWLAACLTAERFTGFVADALGS